MYRVNNSDNYINQRKHANRLVVCGGTSIILSVWSVVRTAILSILNGVPEFDLSQYVVNWDEEKYQKALLFVLIFTILMVVIIFLIQIYIGIRAISEGRNKKKTTVYLVLTAASLVLMVTSCFGGYNISAEDSLAITISSILMDMAAIVAYALILYSAIMKRAYDRKIRNESEE